MQVPKVQGPTVLSGTSDVKLGGANFKVPSNAKCLLGIIPHVSAPGGPTTAEPIGAYVKLQSDSDKIKPLELLCQVVGSNLAKAGIAPMGDAPYYAVNVPITGGSEIEVYGAGLYNHTIEPYVGVTLVLADYLPGPQLKGKLGTYTNTGTAAAEVAGSGIKIHGGSRIKELVTAVLGTTQAAAKGFMGKFRLSSSDFKGMGDITFMAESISGVIATDATTPSAQEVARLGRVKCDVPIESPCDIDDYFTLSVAVTTTGNWVVDVLYI